MPTDGVASGDGDRSPDDVPMCIDNGRPVSAAAANTGSQWPLGNDGSPIGYGFSTKMIPFEPFAAQRSISDRELRVPQRDQRLRDEAIRVGRAPLVDHPVVPRLHAREREVLVVGLEEAVAAEARERREQQLGPHAVFVHRAHPLVDVVRGRDHVVVAAGEEIAALARFAGPEAPSLRVPLELERIEPAFPLPTLHAGFRVDDARRLIAVARRDVIDEDVRRLDHVVVDGDELDVVGEHVTSARTVGRRRGGCTSR